MAYDFDNDVVHGYNPGGGGGIFGPSVKMKRMNPKADSVMKFRLLPAHDGSKMVQMPDGTVQPDQLSWVPFRNSEGRLTPWGRKIYVLQCVGHGPTGKGSRRRDFISLMSYSESVEGGGEVYCPVKTLLNTVLREPQWQYLTKDDYADADKKQLRERRSFGRALGVQLLCNVIDMNDVGSGTQLGIFTSTAYDSLLNKKKGGLACRQNFNVPPESVATNPMLRWAYGDITDPSNGPVFVIQKDGTGQFDGYVVNAEESQSYGLVRYPVDQQTLMRRYNLMDLSSIIPKPSEDDIVAGLCSVLDGFSPSGVHEYELLKHVFGTMFRIPEPPSKAYSPGLGKAPQPGAQPRQQQPAQYDDVDDEFHATAPQPQANQGRHYTPPGATPPPQYPPQQPVQQYAPPAQQPVQQYAPQAQQQAAPLWPQPQAPMPAFVAGGQQPQGYMPQPPAPATMPPMVQPPQQMQQPAEQVHLPGDPVGPVPGRQAMLDQLAKANANRPRQ